MSQKLQKCLVVTRKFTKRQGGAEFSLQFILDELQKNIDGFTYSHTDFGLDPPDGLRRFQFLGLSMLKQRIQRSSEKISSGLVLAQSILAPYLISNLGTGVISVYFVRDQFSWNVWLNTQTGIRKTLKQIFKLVQYPFWKAFQKYNLVALEKSTYVIANSEYSRQQAKRYINREITLIYPYVPVPSQTIALGDDIVLIGCTSDKGIDVAKNIALLLSDYRFRVYGKGCNVRNYPCNMQYCGWIEKKEDMYKGARLVIVPSQWEEAYGRVAIEAQSYGVPVLVSEVGGLAENVISKEYVISRYRDPAVWVEAISKVWGRADDLQYTVKEFARHRCEESKQQHEVFINKLIKENEDQT